jgi:CheY-like chemotaxis protein
MHVALRLPASRADEKAVEPSFATDHRGQRALVVDDQASARELLRALLERAGYEVDEAASGREAVARAVERPCDLVLLDYQMPDWDGAETAVALRRAHAAEKSARKLVIYLLTANVFAREQLEQARSAVDGILEKPLSRATLASLLDSLKSSDAPAVQGQQGALPRFLDARVLDDLCSLTTAQGEPLFDRIFARTREDVARTLEAARQALSSGALRELARHAHELAGQAAILGARDVTTRARALEDVLAAEEHAEPALARRVEGLTRAWQRAERALSRLAARRLVRT